VAKILTRMAFIGLASSGRALDHEPIR
jgi:hypothetical protein